MKIFNVYKKATTKRSPTTLLYIIDPAPRCWGDESDFSSYICKWKFALCGARNRVFMKCNCDVLTARRRESFFFVYKYINKGSSLTLHILERRTKYISEFFNEAWWYKSLNIYIYISLAMEPGYITWQREGPDLHRDRTNATPGRQAAAGRGLAPRTNIYTAEHNPQQQPARLNNPRISIYTRARASLSPYRRARESHSQFAFANHLTWRFIAVKKNNNNNVISVTNSYFQWKSKVWIFICIFLLLLFFFLFF